MLAIQIEQQQNTCQIRRTLCKKLSKIIMVVSALLSFIFSTIPAYFGFMSSQTFEKSCFVSVYTLANCSSQSFSFFTWAFSLSVMAEIFIIMYSIYLQRHYENYICIANIYLCIFFVANFFMMLAALSEALLASSFALVLSIIFSVIATLSAAIFVIKNN